MEDLIKKMARAFAIEKATIDGNIVVDDINHSAELGFIGGATWQKQQECWQNVKKTMPENFENLVILKDGKPYCTETVIVAIETTKGYVYRTNCRQYYPTTGWVWDEQYHGIAAWKPFAKYENNI